ncbi:MAG: sigma-70 family RNA polymerase sigma factor [Planctomycetes bacterium]|nr:sigma-70 family RNA polymerase sigma factor [Planctomycetota bacterium]
MVPDDQHDDDLPDRAAESIPPTASGDDCSRPPPSRDDATRILSRIEAGDPSAAEELLPLVYGELRRLAAAQMACEKPGQTLQPTALVHEAYLRLVDTEEAQRWNSRGHFYAAAAEAMRRILIEHVRKKACHRHGGALRRVAFEEGALRTALPPDELLMLNDAIDALAGHDAVAAQIVKVRYFAGLSVEQAAEVLGISRSTAYEHWAYARAWLFAAVRGSRSGHKP